MFNKTYINNSSPSRIDVVERKAPTDDSIRILNEMQEKAFENIIDCFKISNNDLNDITCWIYPDYNTWNECARIRFKLNDKNIDLTFTLPCKYTNKSTIVELICNKVIEEIAVQITREFLITNIKQIKEIYNP